MLADLFNNLSKPIS